MHEENKVLLSIVIPTRNRSMYLRPLLAGLLSCDRNDFEVVIQDNSDDGGFADYVRSLGDSRVRYQYLSERVSVVRNSDLAVGAANGDYVCMLGDDDGLLVDESLELLASARALTIDAVVPESFYFTWPNLVHKTWGQIGGRLYEKTFTGVSRTIDGNFERHRVLASGTSAGLCLMPRVYQAFVARRVLSRLRAAAGTYFPGPSPDMANAIALTRFTSTVLYCDFPYVIMGHSGGSGGGMGAAKVHRGDIRQQKHLPSDTADTWNPVIPFFWSGPTIYAQSAYRAIAAVWPESERPTLNYARLYSSCLVFEPGYWRETVAAMRLADGPLIVLLARTALGCFTILVQRAVSFVRNTIGSATKPRQKENVMDIHQAIVIARKRIATAGLRKSLDIP